MKTWLVPKCSEAETLVALCRVKSFAAVRKATLMGRFVIADITWSIKEASSSLSEESSLLFYRENFMNL
jgi:hypothetical protein